VTESSSKPEDAMSDPGDKLRQDLMLGLIYPAVLGSIFYTILGELGHQIRSIFSGGAYNVSLIVTVKFTLSWIALAFYFCDYLYIAFTNEYHKRFFRYDILFVFTMYGAFAAAALGENGRLPAAKVLLGLYALFIAFYFDWDRFELRRAKTKEEIDFYRKILRWEGYSFALIMVCLFSIWLLETVWPGKGSLEAWVPSALGAVVMAFVTWRFAVHTCDKKKLSIRYSTEGAAKRAPSPRPQADG
jgi:hypothetical protein